MGTNSMGLCHACAEVGAGVGCADSAGRGALSVDALDISMLSN